MSNSIGKYIQLQGGFAFKSSDFRESGIPLIRISNVTDNGLNKSDAVFLPEEFIDELKDFLLKENDTLIAMSGATTGKCCLIKSTDIPGFINQRVGRFRILNEKETDKLFVYHVVNSSRFKDELLKDAFGSAQPNVSPRDIENVKWDFPSFTEQQQIAKILSTADAVIEKTQAAIAKYKAIKQGMLHDLFTRGVKSEKVKVKSESGEWIEKEIWKLRPRYQDAPELYKESKLGRIPREWDVKELSYYLDFISYGFTNPMPETQDGPYLVTAANVNGGRIQYETARKTSQFAFDTLLTDKSRPKVNDILLTKDGTLGRIAIVKKENLCINQSVAVLRPNKLVNPIFLKILLESPTYQKLMLDDSRGSAIKHIYITDVDKMKVAFPSLDEQQKIAERLKAIDNKLQTEQTYLQKMQSLKKGLMEDLLSGRKSLNLDLQDEPMSRIDSENETVANPINPKIS